MIKDKRRCKDRKSGHVKWLRPDGKTQVSVAYEDGRPVRVSDVLVSNQHAEDITNEEIKDYVKTILMPKALRKWNDDKIKVIVNPSGSFTKGGPAADSGLPWEK